MATKIGTATDILDQIGSATFRGNVELIANVTAADLAKLNNQVTGTITLFNYSQNFTGPAAATTAILIDALKGIKGFKGNLEATTAVTVADLKALKASTQGDLTLTGAALDSKFENVKAADILAAFKGVTGILSAAGIITIKETISLAQAKDLADLTLGVVTATIAPATAAELLAAAATFDTGDKLSVTVKGAYTSTDLLDLGTTAKFDKISLSNKAQALTVDLDVDDVTALVAVLNGTGYKGNVTVTGTTPITEAQLIALNNLTTGKITLNAASLADTVTYDGTAAELVEAFAGITGLKGDVTISSGAVTIAQLKAINKATSGDITVTADQTLSGSAKDLIEALKDVTLSADSTVKVNGPVTLAQILELQKSVDANADLTFTNTSAALTGTTEQIKAALDSALADYKGAIKVTDTISAADLAIINDKTDGKITLTNLTHALNGDAITITGALDGITGYKGAIELTDLSNTVSNINNVAKLTTGKLTATLDATTDIIDATITALKDVNTKDAITFAATDTSADATALLALSKLIPTATFTAVTEITEDAAQIGTNGKNVIDALYKLNNGNTAVDLAGTVSVASVKAINDATTGQISVETVKTAGGAFDLSKLGGLDQVTGLKTIDAQDGKVTNITLSIADILAANDPLADANLIFNIIGDSKDIVTISDAAGWTEVTGDKVYTFANGTGTVTVNLTNVYDVVLPA